MPAKKYIVLLTKEEQKSLEDLTKTGKAAAAKINRAKILLKADINREEGGWKDEAISIALDTSVSTIEQVRQRFVEEGLESALNPRPRTSTPKKLDGEIEGHLIAIACSEAPEGSSRWTLRLLADKIVALGYVDSISHESVRQVLKKTNLSLG